MYNRLEDVTIGAIGFAQLGSSDYIEKRKVEKKVLKEIIKTDFFILPEKIIGIAELIVKKYNYEDSSYNEVAIVYDWRKMDQSDFEDEFWQWVDKISAFDFESEELMDKCERIYLATYINKPETPIINLRTIQTTLFNEQYI